MNVNAFRIKNFLNECEWECFYKYFSKECECECFYEKKNSNECECFPKIKFPNEWMHLHSHLHSWMHSKKNLPTMK